MFQETTAEELLARLRGMGVLLWEEGGQLRYRAPRGALSEKELGLLRQAKAQILDLLRTQDGETALVPDFDHRHEPFPLTDVQAAYLLGRNDAFGYGGVACHVYLEVGYADLDPERVAQAWNHLVGRHDMLRVVVDPAGYQQVLPSVPPLRVPAVDVRGEGQDRFHSALDAAKENLGHRVYETTRWPLFDIRVTRGDERSVLHVSMDFLVADWASIWLLLAEFEALYANPSCRLPPLDVTFRDYVLAERRLREGPAYGRDRDYWWSRIDELPSAPDLPLVDGRDEGGMARFRRRFLKMGRADWEGLKRQAQKRGVTPSAAVMAAYAAVLERWGRSSRFSLNLTVLNRHPLHPAVGRIVGDFTSVSLLAVDWAAGRSFAEQARALGEQLFDDLDHRLFSGVEVVREMARRRGRGAALMPVVFTSAIGLTDSAAAARAQGRLDGRGITQTPQVFIDCQAMDDAEGLQVNWDVREGVFPAGMADDMFSAFEALLNSLARTDSAWEMTEAVALPDWQRRERQHANDTVAAMPVELLHHRVLRQAAAVPERPAVFDARGMVTYGQLAARAAAVAHALAEAGCVPGERVAIVMDKGAHQVAAVLGILAAGAVYVPIDTIQPAVRRETMLAKAGIRLVLTCSEVDVQWPDGIRAIAIDGLAPVSAALPAVTVDPDAPAYVIFTSGSTGTPKGVVISHRAALNTIADINGRFGVVADDRVLALAHLGFDLSVYDIFGLLGAGGALVYPEPARQTDPSHWADLVKRHGVTLWNSVPALMQMLVTYMDTDADLRLPALRLALLSGDWIPLTLPDAMLERMPGIRVVGLGGATEASIWSIYHLYEGLRPGWRSIPYGRPLANQGFRVLDRHMRDCPAGVDGELYITGDGLALGYLDDPQTTAFRFILHPADGQRLYRTGDLGRYMPGGEIEFLGRQDTQVKLKGHRIELGEIEAALLAHPSVAAAVVVVDGEGSERALLGVVEPLRAAAASSALRTAEIAGKAETVAAGLDANQVGQADRALDAVARQSMLRGLLRLGLFADGRGQMLDEILAAGVPSRLHWLARRWVALLCEAGLLARGADGVLTCVQRPDERTWAAEWDRVAEVWGAALGSSTFVAYVRRNAELAAELLSGRQDPVALLFPEGGFDNVRALYRENIMARYLNRAVSTLVRRIADESGAVRPLRVLEVGAGTGGTTESVLEALEGIDLDYWFTDVSASFLPEAKARFGERPGVRFGTFDVDGDYRAQGLSPNSYDIVLAAGVLENARDVAAAWSKLAELAMPGGWVVMTEPTTEHAWILLSQAFMMTEPEDALRAEISYLGLEDWRDLVSGGDAADVLCLPPPGHPLTALGLHLFARQVKTDRVSVRPDELQDFLAQRLPAHMMPSCLQVVDALPLTGNGKVDRRVLAGWRPTSLLTTSRSAEADCGDALETRLCDLWAKGLGLSRLGKSQSFYDHGADSLIMARMAGQLREVLAAEPFNAGNIPFDTLLRQMLNQPTVEALAHFVRERMVEGDAETSPSSACEASAEGRKIAGNAEFILFGTGAGPLRVVFHAGLGTMDRFHALLSHLVNQKLGPVMGIVIADPGRYCALEPGKVIEHIADEYAAHLADEGYERVQLIGYCLGGLIATEVARRLDERGIVVEDLVLVSSHPVLYDVEDDLMIEALFVPKLNITLEQAGFGGSQPDDVACGFMQVIERNGGRVPLGSLAGIGGGPALDRVGGLFRRMGMVDRSDRFDTYTRTVLEVTGQELPKGMAEGLFQVFRQSFHAARFKPPAYAGDIRFLRPTEASGFAPGMDRTTLEFWRSICVGEVSVTDVSGNHFTCTDEPNVRILADIIAAPLER